jgi:arylsulfatase A-like enzyme
MTLSLLSLLACTSRPEPVPREQSSFVRLQDLPFAEPLLVPEHSRATDEPIPLQIPIEGPWSPSLQHGRLAWSAPLPIRPRGMFFHRPEPDMRLLDTSGEEIPYDIGELDPPREWLHDRETIWLIGTDRPQPGQLKLEYPLAQQRESALHLRWSKAGTARPDKFVWTTIQADWDSRSGLLLPAPGRAAWELTVPAAAELSFVEGLVEPEIQEGEGSDGARLRLEVEVGGEVHEVYSSRVKAGRFVPRRVDLSRWAGQQVKLRLHTDPKGSALADYVFLAEPMVASRAEDPVRVVMVFVDTLRPDHMSLYGYERDTTKAIDGLAQSSSVFTSAYTVAPWTLPSARSVVTGRQPEWYETAATVQGLLGKKGWANAFFAGNVYLSVNFDMHLDWDLHRMGGLFPPAEQTTDDALDWLSEHEGRDAIVQVHYMDAHLPYHEPRKYRDLYAGEAHEKLGEDFERNKVRTSKAGQDPEAQKYIQDRYDNNIRYLTDQVQRLVEVLDDNDVLILFSDHGEEFWEHGGYEHGHTLFQELVHVPLVIKAPGLPAGQLQAPVSLLDIAPTVLDLAGQPIPPEMEGWSLVPLMRGEEEARQRFAQRDVSFGRPLYGMEQWGVLDSGHKWMVHEGREALFDLVEDPQEKNNLMRDVEADLGAPYRDALAQTLGREVLVGYRLTPTPARGVNAPKKGVWALCSVPGGFAQAWPGADPLVSSWATVRKLDDRAEAESLLAAYQITNHPLAPDAGAVEICWHPGRWGTREVYLVPDRPLAEVGMQMLCSGYLGNAEGGKRATIRIAEDRSPTLGRMRTPLNKLLWKDDERQLLWQYGVAPAPIDAEALVARDGETDSMLQALGYQMPEGGSVPEGEAIGKLPPCEPPAVPLVPLPASHK